MTDVFFRMSSGSISGTARVARARRAAERDAQVHRAASAAFWLLALQAHGHQVGGACLGPEGALGEANFLGRCERDVIDGRDGGDGNR